MKNLLDDLRNNIKTLIELKTESLKAFIINDEEVQLTTDTLNKITFRVTGESAMNKSRTSLWFNNKKYDMPINEAMKLIYKLQVYFGNIYDVSEIHKNQIDTLNDEELLNNYCYDIGYPDKIIFETNKGR